MHFHPAFILWGVIAAAVAAIVAAGRLYRRSRANARLAADERKCPCGYILKGMTLPRCPECGRAIGFDKTFDELGIRPEELRDKGARSR
jgi:hypothetical protein